ncbi:MAG: hypothetical protein KGD64_03705 [Candidatus Heimdallarchaeota archaeon]|nr:hypothetical protein [Candidatus Heimdallarchaeota archaeon]
MTDRVLNILRRQGKRVHCLFDGDLLEALSSSCIKLLMEQIEQIGSIRKNLVVFDHQLKPDEYELFISRGITPMIVPSDKDVYLALECLDVVYSQQTDVLCVGVNDESMLPILAKVREKSEILLISGTKNDAENYLPYVDYLITLKDLKENVN